MYYLCKDTSILMFYKNYLIKADFTRRFNRELFDQLTDGNDALWKTQEQFSLKKIANYVKVSYDIDKELIETKAWAYGAVLNAGDRVSFTDGQGVERVYSVLVANSSNIDPTEDPYSFGEDDRNLTIVGIAVDLVLYDLQCQSVNQLTEIAVKRNDDAISMLKDIRQRKLQIDLPQYDEKKDTAHNIIIVPLDQNKSGQFPY